MDGDGEVDITDSLLGSGSYPANNGAAVIAFNLVVEAGETVHLLVVDDFSATAQEGTYQANINAGGLSATSATGNAQFAGLPSNGAIITILHATVTPTATFTRTSTPQPTASASATSTSSPTPSLTPTATSIPTETQTETPTPTDTLTPTASATPTFTNTGTITLTATATEQPGNDKPVIYPNPSDGTQPVNIHIPGRTGTSDVTVQIFTVAFRLVQHQVFEQVPLGTDIHVELKDKWGHPLASGLYYVVVNAEGNPSINSGHERMVGKLMIIR
jgi:hypothetical protein